MALALRSGNAESVVGRWTLTLDAERAIAELTPVALRTAQANDDLYLLPVTRFFGTEGVRVERLRKTATTIELDYTLTHPYPAPADPLGAPNGFSNRADLGIAGRMLFLVDVPSAVGNTYFTDRVANTAVIVNPDAYWSPEDLLPLTTTANLFPYQSLVDENGATGSRIDVSNGGDPTGNFGTDGWTRAEFGGTNDGWTGYGVLHQGQRSERTLILDRATLEATGPLTFDFALIAKYNDPRGGVSGVEKRSNRLPPATPDAGNFAYRMPHGALDVERIDFRGESGGLLPNQLSASEVRFHVIDWDSRAVETTAADLSEDPAFTTVAVGESGIPGLAISLPGVIGDATTVEVWDPSTLEDDDSAYGGDPGIDAGLPGDALFFANSLTNLVANGQSGSATYTGLVRATDVETALSVSLLTPLDADLSPLSGVAPAPITYQVFRVTLADSNQPPTGLATITTTQVPTGTGVTVSLTDLADPDDATITASFDWNDDGTDDFTTAPIPVPAAGPMLIDSVTNGGFTFTFTGPAPDYRTLAVSLSDGTNTVDITPALGPNNEHFEVLEDAPGWIRTWGASSGDTRCWDVAVDGAGNAYVGGFLSNGANLGTGPLTTVGQEDILVAKYDPAGTLQWVRTYGSPGKDEAQAIGVDAAGNCYVTGSYAGSINFGNGNRPYSGFVDGFMLKLNSAGTLQWDKTFNTSGDDRGWGVGVNDSGTQVAFTGMVGIGGNFGGGVHPSNRRFVVTYDAAGTWLWQPTWDATPGTNIYGDVAFDHADAVIAMGHFKGTADFGGGPRTVTGYDPGPPVVDPDDAFLVKWDSAGMYQWDAVFGGASTEVGQGLAVDSGNNVYIAGKAFGSANFGSTTAPGASQFLVKVSPAGAYLWDFWFSSNGSNWGCAVDAADNVLVTGGYTGGANFGGGARPAPTSFGGFVMKRSAAGAWLWDVQYATGSGVNYTFGLATAPDSSLRVAGNFQGTQDFEPGPNVTTASAVGPGYSAFLGRINSDGLW